MSGREGRGLKPNSCRTTRERELLSITAHGPFSQGARRWARVGTDGQRLLVKRFVEETAQLEAGGGGDAPAPVIELRRLDQR